MSAKRAVDTPPDVLAAGGLVRRVRRQRFRRRVEYLLVHRPRYDDWTFPKGKRDPGDRDDLATALREVEEETGLACSARAEIGATRYRDSKGRDKLVRYWLMDLPPGVSGNDFEPNREVDQVRWCRAADAARLLTYEHDRVLLPQVEGVR